MIRSLVQLIYFFGIYWSPIHIVILLFSGNTKFRNISEEHYFSPVLTKLGLTERQFFEMLTVTSEKEELCTQINYRETLR